MVEREAMRLIESVPDAVSNMQGLVKEFSTLPKKDHKNRELSYRATVKALEAAGILPNASPTIFNVSDEVFTLISIGSRPSPVAPRLLCASATVVPYLEGLWCRL